MIEYNYETYQIIDELINNYTRYVSCILIDDLITGKIEDCKIFELTPNGYQEIEDIEEYEKIVDLFLEKTRNE